VVLSTALAARISGYGWSSPCLLQASSIGGGLWVMPLLTSEPSADLALPPRYRRLMVVSWDTTNPGARRMGS